MFEQAYARLNSAQRQAVDTIDGPVLVIAGPGTGKTQLLSMRVANILRQTDVAPHNILCLTFTEEAARNMQERLSGIIGQAAYDVHINTFHGFGASIIAQYGEYFYQGIGATPLDDLSAHRLMRELFLALPPDSPLAVQYEGDFLFLRGARQVIDNFKSAGLAPDEVQSIARHNLDFCAAANAIIARTMEGFSRIGKDSLPYFKQLASQLQALHLPSRGGEDTPFVLPLNQVVGQALQEALATCQESGKTTSLTEFKNRFLSKNEAGQWQLKDTEASIKLLALGTMYQQYLLSLRQADLLDFNDMITRVVHALEVFPKLKLNLQEQYQYILVDEFQDTSLAQLRIVQALTDNPLFEGRPNVLAVGDDDQAIYSFQGAELSNILTFLQSYRNVTRISLTANYRSHQAILDTARFVIEQSAERLTHLLNDLDKTITAHSHNLPAAHIAHHRFASADQQYQWVASDISRQLQHGLQASNIAVIAPKHSGLKAIVPFLHQQDIALSYQKRENILEVPAIVELLTTARLVHYIASARWDMADALLPEVLSYKFWGLGTGPIWEFSLHNQQKHAPWIELALQYPDPAIKNIARFLQELSRRAHSDSLEHLLDMLIGVSPCEFTPPTEDSSNNQDPAQLSLLASQTPKEHLAFTSPFDRFYFGTAARAHSPVHFLELISHLTFLRNRLRDFYASEQLHLAQLIEYVDMCHSAGISLIDSTPHREHGQTVSLHTAHSAKGLEFGAVYLVDANHDIWVASNRQGSIAMPANLPIERAATTEDERRRLLYVAMTRAKHNLTITGFAAAKRGNAPLKYLAAGQTPPPAVLVPQEHHAAEAGNQALEQQIITRWHDRHNNARQQPLLRELLQPTLQNYRLSITHLQTFLDVTQGGPERFFLECLLRFPKATTWHMALGNAVHQTLDSAQKHLKQTGHHRPIADLLAEFAHLLQQCHLQPTDHARCLQEGQTMLQTYLAERYPHFSADEFFEFDLAGRHIMLGEVRLTGKIDRVTPLGNDTFRVADFKTGKAVQAWQGSGHSPSKHIQLYHYKQQLTLYRLLLEESKAFGANTKVSQAAVEFIRPLQGQLVAPLEYWPDDQAVNHLRQLLTAVWQKIVTLDFPDISAYDQSLKGILAFEADLCAPT